MPTYRDRRIGASRLTALVFVLTAACGQGGGGDAAPTTTVEATTTTTLPPVAPLTGLPLADPAKLARPALAVKVDNAPVARPQSGLDAADVVVEEIVEGGSTRFLAFFHSTDADLIGPVRSVRPSDPDILSPFRALFGYSGGTDKFIEQLRSAPGVVDVGVDLLGEKPGEAYTRRPGRSAPNNLYTSTANLYSRAPAGAGPPPPFADFLPAGEAFAPPGATPATSVTATIGTTSAAYSYDLASRTYKRTGLVEGAGAASPAVVIIQFTNYQPSPGDVDTTGAAVEKAVTVGSGDAVVVAGGVAVKARWSRPSATAYTAYTDEAGAPIKLPAGRRWVELARPGAAVSTS